MSCSSGILTCDLSFLGVSLSVFGIRVILAVVLYDTQCHDKEERAEWA